MKTLFLNDSEIRLDAEQATVDFVVKTHDTTYFEEKILIQKRMSVGVFLLLLPLLLGVLLLLSIISGIHKFWANSLFFLFKEKNLVSIEEAQQRLDKYSVFASLSPEQEVQLLSKKNLPLGL